MKLSYDPADSWNYENGFYLTSDKNRIPKLLAHYELYKKIMNIPGHVIEFGVYKGMSLVKWLTFRDSMESEFSRKVFGFDIFGKFPDEVHMDSDKEFIKRFEDVCGDSIDVNELDEYLKMKNFRNYELVQGDIMKTLPAFLKKHPEYKFSLVHIDVDVYEPTKKVLDELLPHVARGGVIVLDDYGSVEGETLAIDENDFLKKYPIRKLSTTHSPAYIVLD